MGEVGVLIGHGWAPAGQGHLCVAGLNKERHASWRIWKGRDLAEVYAWIVNGV